MLELSRCAPGLLLEEPFILARRCTDQVFQAVLTGLNLEPIVSSLPLCLEHGRSIALL